MNIDLKYGNEKINISLDRKYDVDIITPTTIGLNPLDNLIIDFSPLHLMLSSKGIGIEKLSVGIAINDKTRPVPYSILIPPLINELERLGVHNNNITFFISNGTHVPDNNLTYLQLPNKILNLYRFLQHDSRDASNLIHLGSTKNNTPIILNRSYYECDLKICIGNIEPHHFAGYSGGAKTVAIGLASHETITHNHSFLMDPNSVSCEYQNNKVRQDIEEIGIISGLDLALNCIQTSDLKILRIFFDRPAKVMQQSIPIINQISTSTVTKLYDFVIASAGGYPKDINFYQSQKACSNAAKIIKKNGKLLLLAECKEGPGSDTYFNYMKNFSNSEEIIKHFENEKFVIGQHKAYLMAKIQSRIDVYLYSKMNDEIVKTLLLNPVKDIKLLLSSTNLDLENKTIAIMPDAVTTIPIFFEE